MKILVAAYACEPDKGSEPGAGWHTVRALAREHEVWVITRANNERSISQEIAANPDAHRNLHVVYFDLPRLAALKSRTSRGTRAYHYLWHLALYRLARQLAKRISFDVATFMTIGNYRTPTALALLRLPVVVGPVGGGERVPLSFWPSLGLVGLAQEAVRMTVIALARVDPLLYFSYRRAAAVVAATDETRAELLRIATHSKPVIVLPHIGIDSNAFSRSVMRKPFRSEGQFSVLAVARLEAWKGIHLGIQAFAKARRECPTMEMTVLGRGPEEPRLRRLAAELHVQNAIRFVPFVDDIASFYAGHDALIFPSLRESGGMAVVEGMAAGLPVICLDLGGPGMSVTEDTGFKVSADSPTDAVREMADSLVALARDADCSNNLAHRGRERAFAEYDWDVKATRLTDFYRLVVARSLPARYAPAERSE